MESCAMSVRERRVARRIVSMQRACAASKVGCTGFKMRKLALAIGKHWGGIARTPPGVNVHPLMWPGELINSERSSACSSRLRGPCYFRGLDQENATRRTTDHNVPPRVAGPFSERG